MTIEEKTARTLLQTPQKVTVGDVEYTVAHPTLATLVLASSLISKLPPTPPDNERIAEDSLAMAKDCGRTMGEIAAAVILGADGYGKPAEWTVRQRRFCGLIPYGKPVVNTMQTAGELLAEKIMNSYSPSEMNTLIASLLSSLELTDFFALTTFLTGINLTRTTKVGK